MCTDKLCTVFFLLEYVDCNTPVCVGYPTFLYCTIHCFDFLLATQVFFSAAESNNSNLSDEDKTEVDLRSVYVGNVDYGSTADELEAHFRGCGPINRVTILCNKFTGHPKGFAYIEFDTRDAVEAAIALDDSSFRSRQLKVLPKRTNVPGMSMTNRPPFVRGRARGRGVSFGFRPTYAGRMRFPRYR
ncbi:Polyadenylate-binding protein 2-B [Schistosoma japonicum]|nr:Polyadenylate-binding protein 2-B [Schistosoma japonicum]KAH8863369.1 Polyadenylate-binding protein 2-B [Schistosoma japonicum]